MDRDCDKENDESDINTCRNNELSPVKRFKEKVENYLKTNPLMFGNFAVKQKVSDKYLGQVLHSGGVETTVQERSGRIKGATMEIRSMVEEYQMQAFGGIWRPASCLGTLGKGTT